MRDFELIQKDIIRAMGKIDKCSSSQKFKDELWPELETLLIERDPYIKNIYREEKPRAFRIIP